MEAQKKRDFSTYSAYHLVQIQVILYHTIKRAPNHEKKRRVNNKKTQRMQISRIKETHICDRKHTHTQKYRSAEIRTEKNKQKNRPSSFDTLSYLSLCHWDNGSFYWWYVCSWDLRFVHMRITLTHTTATTEKETKEKRCECCLKIGRRASHTQQQQPTTTRCYYDWRLRVFSSSMKRSLLLLFTFCDNMRATQKTQVTHTHTRTRTERSAVKESTVNIIENNMKLNPNDM